MRESLVLESPAKVNLRLEILGKREDGYHELHTIFQKISLQDKLHLSLKRGRGISIMTDHPGLPVGKNNLVYKAAQSILKRSNYRGGIVVEIEKRIPLGAGLGGGSSNAAATLKALNQLLKIKLSRKELTELGLEIGADVPFFFVRGAALGSGIGERLKKLEVTDLWFVLIYPNFEISARWAYERFDGPRKAGAEGLTNQKLRTNLNQFLKTPKGVSKILFNHLEAAVSEECPQIDAMKKMLLSAGAMGALMTGSGPTVYGVFPEEVMATKAFEKIRKSASRRGWAVFKAHSISV